MRTTHVACGQHCFPQLNLAQFDMRAALRWVWECRGSPFLNKSRFQHIIMGRPFKTTKIAGGGSAC